MRNIVIKFKTYRHVTNRLLVVDQLLFGALQIGDQLADVLRGAGVGARQLVVQIAHQLERLFGPLAGLLGKLRLLQTLADVHDCAFVLYQTWKEAQARVRPKGKMM